MSSTMNLTEEILKEWKNAVLNSEFGYHQSVLDFKSKYPNEYKLITAMYRKRVALNDTIEAMKDMNEPIYWFTLTFNNSKDTNAIESKRKEATRFLNNICICYVLVEEFGEDNGRYHLHGFLVFKYGYGFIDFTEWHSRQKLELIEGYKIKKKIRYLTKYAVKQVPRIRRSKTMSTLYGFYKRKKVMKKCFPSVYASEYKKLVANVTNPF